MNDEKGEPCRSQCLNFFLRTFCRELPHIASRDYSNHYVPIGSAKRLFTLSHTYKG